MEQETLCKHKWEEKGDRLICSNCSKYKLNLKQTDNEHIKVGIRSDGKSYKVRKSRHDVFYPFEWLQFERVFKNKDKFVIFDSLINLGGRIDEHLHIRKKDLIEHGNQVYLWKTKTKAKKGETEGSPRSPGVTPKHFRALKKKATGLADNEYIFHSPKDKTKPMTSTAVYKLFKKKLAEAGLDPERYSLHNIRKTHGRWLSVIGISEAKICSRLGHDMNTYLAHYSNPIPFTAQDVSDIRNRFKDLIIN